MSARMPKAVKGAAPACRLRRHPRRHDGQLLRDWPPHREAEQQGKRRAGYGEQLIARLSPT